MENRIRIGLIGYGDWTRTAYLPAIEADGRGCVVAVAVPSTSSRERALSELGVGVTIYAEVDQLLAGTEVDALMVAVSESAHAETIGAAFDSGKAVFYECPLANKRSEIPAMIQRLLISQGPTHADIELGFLPVVRRAKQLVTSGSVGTPQFAEVRLESDWGAFPDEDLCKVNSLSPWYVDLLDRILARNPSRVLTMNGTASAARAQAQSIAQLDYDGVWGTFAVNTNAVDGPDMRLSLSGTDGDIRVDLLSGLLRWRNSSSPEWTEEVCSPIKPVFGLPGMHECVRAFFNSVESHVEGGAGRQRIARLHLLGLAAEQSRDTGTWVEVDDVLQ